MNVINVPIQITDVVKTFRANAAGERSFVIVNPAHMGIHVSDFFVKIGTVGAREHIHLIVFIFHVRSKLHGFDKTF
jgi:hypothetical protein